jgi:prepilin-type N-terminal cleavage/methylation domain-containing protein
MSVILRHPPAHSAKSHHRGITLLEVIIAMMIFSFFLAAFYRVMERVVGRTSQRLSERLVLQMEARRALLNVYRHLQEGIEIVTPPPGSTLPYLVYRDLKHNFGCMYLEPDQAKTQEEGKPIYRVMHLKRDPSGATAGTPTLIMDRVSRLNFTTHSPSGLLLNLTLAGGKGEYSLINFVRLKNSVAED